MADQEQQLPEVLDNTDLEKALHHLLTSEHPHQEHDKTNIITVNQNTKNDEGDSNNNNNIDSASTSMHCAELFDSDIMQGKHLTLESILDDQGTGIFFDLDQDEDQDDSRSPYNTSYDIRKRPSPTTYDDSKALMSKKTKYANKTVYEQLLSPVSLSPSSTDDSSTNGQPNINTASVTSSRVPLNGKLAEKFSNEFTLNQVFEMKKRIINTHKLMLNFNFLKDGYARTCVEIKKVMHNLKDSEIHRAHLLQENEDLKKKVSALSARLELREHQPQNSTQV